MTPLYLQKLALTSPTGCGRSVGIVRSRTKATEFSFSLSSVSAIITSSSANNSVQKAVPMQVVTNPVTFPSFYGLPGVPFLLGTVNCLFVCHTIGATDLTLLQYLLWF